MNLTRIGQFFAASSIFVHSVSFAAGILTPVNRSDEALRIENHEVSVVINNGFAQTKVIQQFFNPNDSATEAIFTIPLPKHASLAEMTIATGESVLEGEVVAKQEAEAHLQGRKGSGQ